LNLPDLLIKVLDELKPREVQYGAGGLMLFPASELEVRQIGYAIGADGSSFCGPEEGYWRRNWIVIGEDTCLGDPIFIDTQSDDLPVFTAMHGEGIWKPEPVAISLKAFAQCWDEFSRIAKGRSNPVEQEENPLSQDEIDAFLDRVQKINSSRTDIEYWQEVLEF
jgi:hypothetical protein